MALNDTAKALLVAIAEAVAAKREANLNLFNIMSALEDHEGVVAFLAQQVERISGGNLTVRPSSYKLFAYATSGPNNYLALCPSSTPPGEVAEFKPEIQLFNVGPYRNGYSLEDPKPSK